MLSFWFVLLVESDKSYLVIWREADLLWPGIAVTTLRPSCFSLLVLPRCDNTADAITTLHVEAPERRIVGVAVLYILEGCDASASHIHQFKPP